MKSIEKSVADINEATKPTPTLAEPPAFVNLSEKLAESIIESAQIQFNTAEQMLEEAKQYANQLREEIKQRAEALHDLKNRLEAFGASVISAHQKFHNGKEDSQ